MTLQRARAFFENIETGLVEVGEAWFPGIYVMMSTSDDTDVTLANRNG